MKRIGLLAAIGLIVGMISCTEQYNPRPYWKKWDEQRTASVQPEMKLNDDGTIPTGGKVEEVFDIAEVYGMYCANCHGATGMGDGPGAATEPKPRNFVDAAWQNQVDDARIATVIRDGGMAVGLSPTMAPWGSVLGDAKIEAMVKHVRSFSK